MGAAVGTGRGEGGQMDGVVGDGDGERRGDENN